MADIDHREDLIPEALRQQQALYEKTGEDLIQPLRVFAPTLSSPSKTKTESPVSILQSAIDSSRGESVEITHGVAGTFKLTVLEVASGEDGIALVLDKRQTSFVPNAEQRYRIKWDGRVYDVVYLGGSFQFNSSPVRVVCFLNDQPDA